MIDNVVAVKRKEAEGQFDLFGGMGEEQSDEPGFGLDVQFTDDEWDKTYLLAQEREMLGLYVSDHPLFGLEHVLSDKADAGISQLTGGDFGDGAVVTIGGIISGLQRKMTKQGNAWAIATVEDLAGSIECMFFPATYQLVSTQLVEDAVVFVKGLLDKREDVPRLVAMELMVPDLSNASAPTRPWCSPSRPPASPRRWSAGSARSSPTTRATARSASSSRGPPGRPCCGSTGTGSSPTRPCSAT